MGMGKKSYLILVQVLIVSVCSIIYELLLATTSANITGNSLRSYSIAIGLFLAGLGTGAFVSRWIKTKMEADLFIFIEMALAFCGGFASISLFLSLTYTRYFSFLLVVLTFLIGFLSGFEIPLLTRIFQAQKKSQLKSVLANMLSFDYLGGLVGSLLFPFILLPYLGIVRLSFLTGTVNIFMALLAIYLFWPQLKFKFTALISSVILLIVLIFGAVFSTPIYNFAESNLYRDPIIYSQTSQFQRIVITQKNQDLRMYLNGGIQFSSLDEYRYHEALVIPSLVKTIAENDFKPDLKIAIFGGGDGLIIKQLQKFDDYISKVVLVDIDSAVTEIANTELLSSLNENAFKYSKLELKNEDVSQWIKTEKTKFNLIISDLPDPDDAAIAKLYAKEFYTWVKLILQPGGIFVTQATSIYSTPKAHYGILKTMANAFNSQPINYASYVPSFGLWGFILVQPDGKFEDLENTRVDFISQLEELSGKSEFQPYFKKLEYLTPQSVSGLFNLDKDILLPKLRNFKPLEIEKLEINTFNNLVLTNYYLESNG